MKTKLLIIFILVFGLISCSEENINTIEINKNQTKDLTEAENIKIDEYNFEQLEKVKNILDGLNKDSYSFENLKEFNEEFDQDITPIKNCYFLSYRNKYFDNKKGGGGYIFGFELNSEKYVKIYGESYIAYPKYDLPFSPFCDGGDSCDTDFNLMAFGETIST